MSNNNKPKHPDEKLILKVTLLDGRISVDFGQVNLALISHAIRLAGLQVDNQIIASQSPKPSKIDIPKGAVDGIINKIRRRS